MNGTVTPERTSSMRVVPSPIPLRIEAPSRGGDSSAEDECGSQRPPEEAVKSAADDKVLPEARYLVKDRLQKESKQGMGWFRKLKLMVAAFVVSAILLGGPTGFRVRQKLLKWL